MFAEDVRRFYLSGYITNLLTIGHLPVAYEGLKSLLTLF